MTATRPDEKHDAPDDVPAELATHSLSARLARQARLKAVYFIAVLAAGSVWLAFIGGAQHARLGLGGGQATSMPINAPVWLYGTVAAVICAVCAFYASRCGSSVRDRRRVTILVMISVVVAIVALIAWAARDGQASLSGIIALSVSASVPIIMGSTSGVLAERSGTFNIAIEGQLLVGAFTSALVATVTHNAWAGLASGTVAGFGLGALLAVLTIRFRVAQVVAGFVLVTLATGLTGYLSEQVMNPDLPKFNSPTVFGTWSIPVLDKIPVIGAGLFAQSPIFYLAVIVVIAVEFLLRRTTLGLRIRAVGESPKAAQSSGIKARRIRFWATAASGAIGGAGGAYFTIGSAGQFVVGVSSGLGYVALAAVILGSWRAAQAAAAALLFGFASSISAVFGLLQVNIPPSILAMAPYVITILVVAGVVAVGRGPAAAGLDID